MKSLKTPLLLLPGLLCDEKLWRPQIEYLRDIAEITVADLTRDDTIAGMAARAISGAPREFALAGLSMGGYVALEIMRQARARVSRLALLDTSARADTPEQTKRRRGLIELAQKGKFKGVTPQLLPFLIHPSRAQETELTDRIMAMAEAIGMDAFLRHQSAIMGRLDSRPMLPGIECPTLVLCGREDALTPLELHDEMAGLVPGASQVIIDDCGHLSTLERPEQVNAALRSWLEGGPNS